MDNTLPASAKKSASKNILIVEDEKPLRRALEEALNRESFVTLVAKNGEEGLRIALERHPDLILLDVIMPEMNGVEMLRKLRADVWGKTASVLVFTNDTDPEHVGETMENDVTDYLMKIDWEIEDVIKKIKAILMR